MKILLLHKSNSVVELSQIFIQIFQPLRSFHENTKCKQMIKMADRSAISHWVWSLIDYIPEEGTQVRQVVTKRSPSVLQVDLFDTALFKKMNILFE